jgi:hypothetical protein
MLLEAAGQAPLSHGAPRNIAEAAAMASGSEVLRRLRQGDEADRVLPVRPELISSSVTRVTALEAAVWAREGALLRLLIDSGAITDDDTRRHLACLARDIGAQDLAADLTVLGDPECVVEEAYGQVLGRSRDEVPEQ